MAYLLSKLFWLDAVERALKTFAQTAVALITVAAPMTDTSLLDINYAPIILTGIVAALISILTSLASASVGSEDSASLVVDTKRR